MGIMSDMVKKEIEFRLPIVVPEKFEILVESGDIVKKNQVIAKVGEPRVQVWNVARDWNVEIGDMASLLMINEGARVLEGMVVMKYVDKKNHRYELVAPFDGKLEVDYENGEVRLIEDPKVKEILANHDAKIELTEGVWELVFEAWAVSFDFGWGKSAVGKLGLAGADVDVVTLPWLNRSYQGVALVVPYITQHLWHKANALGVVAVISGNLPSNYELWFDENRDDACLLAYGGDESKWEELLKLLSSRVGDYVYVLGDSKQLIVDKKNKRLKKS